MKFLSVFCLLFIFNNSFGQVVLNADGLGNTYSLITSVLAPGHNPIEVPDCNHAVFGEHIDEVFDSELNTHVFRFHIHTATDNDRCINFDRQRNEIKSYDKSPDNLLGIEDEMVVYKWKFKLDAGFQSSPNFTHIHQLKSVGGSLASMPMYTLTTRKGSPDQLELRYAETNSQTTLLKTDLSTFKGTWVEVTEVIKYGASGTYNIVIKRVSDNATLFSYSNNNIINWRSGADFVRPKWGIYRSLNNAQDLRDETVLFANFSVEETVALSINDKDLNSDSFVVFQNPVESTLYLKNISQNANLLEVFTMDGRKIMDKTIYAISEVKLDVSSFSNGTYVLSLQGQQLKQTKLVVISNK
ncbi:T9SS type A sorting domain-containing protein [Flavivirga aquimarina]|uniref:T9SS type A sorting domain-containing protein n=1 Tax=Flavivirga aquimarina TaxID=2027862 RepID=A0ABT8W9J3_9FLAO|nr:T9SS type A sorting domain-containing protein [Flavivirga aquimarina]MDO5969766.1 T9SS type A sorting domain-containing protein [Flavivirga aquimarina]